MKTLIQSIQEKLVFNKHTKAKTFNSIQDLSDKYDFDIISSELQITSERKQFYYKVYKVSNDLFKNNICDKIVELNDKELMQYENDLCYHFKDILDNKYIIELTNYTNDDQVCGVIRIVDENDKMMASALYDCIKSTVRFKILEDEEEAEKILVNIIDYIVNN